MDEVFQGAVFFSYKLLSRKKGGAVCVKRA